VSAEWIAEGRGDQRLKLDVSSVYRNLERLEEIGLVRHVHLGHGPGLYALEDERQLEYLVCETCDRVDTVEASELDELRAGIRERFGYQVQFNHFPIVGRCPRCSGADVGDHDHDHQHSHGDRVHSHPHAHGDGPGHSHSH
jgi:Fur family transcriptional regulator, ferric uptake regulator